jgi:hypothetical protein
MADIGQSAEENLPPSERESDSDGQVGHKTSDRLASEMTSSSSALDSSKPKFVLAEYSTLEKERISVLAVRDRQINLYIALASTITAASVIGEALVQPQNRDSFRISVGLASVTFALFGAILSYRIVQAQLSSTVYLRAMSRIRNLFAAGDLELQRYLVLPINDDVPRFSDMFLFPGPFARLFTIDVFAFVNAGAVHLGTSLLMVQLLPTGIDKRFALLASFILALFFLGSQIWLHRRQLKWTQNRFLAQFPSRSTA